MLQNKTSHVQVTCDSPHVHVRVGFVWFFFLFCFVFSLFLCVLLIAAGAARILATSSPHQIIIRRLFLPVVMDVTVQFV